MRRASASIRGSLRAISAWMAAGSPRPTRSHQLRIRVEHRRRQTPTSPRAASGPKRPQLKRDSGADNGLNPQ